MKCKKARIAASRGIDRELTPAKRAALDAHVRDCPDCERDVQRLRAADAMAAAALADFGSAIAVDDVAALAAEARARNELPLMLRPSTTRAFHVIAASILVVIGIGLAMSHLQQAKPRRNDDQAITQKRPTRFHSSNVSCEIDPRGVDVHWATIDPAAIQEFEIVRIDASGKSERFTTSSPSYRDTQIEPGEEYFYVVRARDRDDSKILAYVGTTAAAPDAIDDDWTLRYLGGTPHVALIEVSFEEDGQRHTAVFHVKAGEKIGGDSLVPGRGLASFATPFVLVDIQWEVERTVVDLKTGDPKQVASRAARLAAPDGEPRTLWMRD